MKKTIISLIVLIIIGFAAYSYATRTPSAPSRDINSLNGEPAAEGTYRISQEGSVAEFRIYELLRGNPFTVVGTTTQIAGDIAIGTSSIDIGTIRINARTFVTDDERRNGAIARLILRSESPENEFIVFEPTSIQGGEGFWETESADLVVTGDLTISGETRPATFDVSIERQGDEIVGAASTTLARSDFGLIVPDLPFIADVPDEFSVSAQIRAISTE